MQIIPVASGKGGVGKSLIAANLAIALAQGGHDVILADLDLGGSNLHIMMGLPAISDGIGVFLKNRKNRLADHIITTNYDNLRFIPGDTDIPGLANLTAAEKQKLLGGLKSLSCEYLILDLGAGTGIAATDFFLLASRGMIVIMPTLTSTLNAYLFLKNALFRLLYQLAKPKSKAWQLLKKPVGPQETAQKYNLIELLKRLKTVDPKVHGAFQKKIQRFRPRLVLNLMENEKDAAYADRVRRSLSEYLGLEVEHLGVIYRDVMQDIALNSRLPIIIYKPHSVLSQAIYRIADKVYSYPDSGEALIELDPDGTFQAAEIEARIDFQEKVRGIEELMQSGSLSDGDLLDIIKQQYVELSNLKKENQLLKMKLSKAVREGFLP